MFLILARILALKTTIKERYFTAVNGFLYRQVLAFVYFHSVEGTWAGFMASFLLHPIQMVFDIQLELT